MKTFPDKKPDIYFLILCLFIFAVPIDALALQATGASVFPYQVEDKLIFEVFQDGFLRLDDIRMEFVKDSADAEGNRFFYAEFPDGDDPFPMVFKTDPEGRVWATRWLLKDPGFVRVFDPDINAEGQRWFDPFEEYDYFLFAEVVSRDSSVIFGEQRPFINITYNIVGDSTNIEDTVLFDVASDVVLHEQLGITSWNFPSINRKLKGAVINGEVVGDTTVVFTSNESIGQPETRPQSATLHQNYPNPFNPATIITFELANPAEVTLKIYDILGRKIDVLVENRRFASGKHQEVWNPSNDISSGIYFYQLKTDTQILLQSMTLIK